MAVNTPSLRNLGFTIVCAWFPPSGDYRVGFKAAVLANNNMPDAMIIQVKALISNPKSSEDIMERQILLVECKRPSRDTPLGWDDTITGQFLDDLSQTLNFSERLFGAVAIGKKVKFYQFDGKAQVGQQLAPLHQGILDMDDPNGCSQVEGMMNHIKANAWQWAISL